MFLLNGFGDREAIETICADIAAESGVTAHYDAADMSKPEAIEALASHMPPRCSARSTSSSTTPAFSIVGPIENFPVAKWDAISGGQSQRCLPSDVRRLLPP